jgi:glycosyltransferase involved in cell wall biosynthesis
MDFSGLRIGYVPCSNDLNVPGDKLRFCYYADKRNITFDIADPSKDYDLIILTERSDKSVWGKYHNSNVKIVYDIVDSYLSVHHYDIKGMFRGLAKYLSGESRHLQLNYWKAIENLCRRSDAVVCGTDEQKNDLMKFCSNTHIVLDFTNSVVRKIKRDYSSGDVFNFVWAGLPYNIGTLFVVKEALRQLKPSYRIALHIVTNLQYYKYMGRYWQANAADLANTIYDNVYLHEWDDETCSDIITACDLALLPAVLNNPFNAGKPVNRLLLFWRMGMPVVVSATPAYSRAMEQCGLPMVCWTRDEWSEILEKYIKDKDARGDAGTRGRAFAEQFYNEETILAQWDNVFKSVLGGNR